jgi:SOS-response transcriptional repressor LexA
VSIFAPDGRTTTATIPDDALEALDIRAGDQVVVVGGRTPEHGDLALIEEDGAEAVWKVYPEGTDLLLSTGTTRRSVPADSVRVLGVVVGLLRRLPADQ